MDLKRFSIVPVDSSAARIPLPRATIALATLASSLMVRLLFETNGEERRVRTRLDSTARALTGASRAPSAQARASWESPGGRTGPNTPHCRADRKSVV